MHNCQGGLRAETSREGKLFSMTFKHSFVCCKPHCNWTSQCPFSTALVPACCQPQHGCAIRCSGATTAFSRICNEGGRQQKTLWFSFTGMLFSVPITKKKKGITFALEFSPKCKFRRIFNISVPCSSALPLTVTYFNRQLYKYECGSPRAECHSVWWNFQKNVPQDFPKFTTLNNVVISIQGKSRLHLLEI